MFCSLSLQFGSKYATRKLSFLQFFFFCKSKASKHFLPLLFLIFHLNHFVLSYKRKELKWKPNLVCFAVCEKETEHQSPSCHGHMKSRYFRIVSQPVVRKISKRNSIEPEVASDDMISSMRLIKPELKSP